MDMRRSLAIVMLLGLVGLFAGVIATELGPSHTPYTAT